MPSGARPLSGIAIEQKKRPASFTFGFYICLIRQYRIKLATEPLKIPRIARNPMMISQCHHSMSAPFLPGAVGFGHCARFSPDNIQDQFDRFFHGAGDRLAQTDPFCRFEGLASYDQYASRRASERFEKLEHMLRGHRMRIRRDLSDRVDTLESRFNEVECPRLISSSDGVH